MEWFNVACGCRKVLLCLIFFMKWTVKISSIHIHEIFKGFSGFCADPRLSKYKVFNFNQEKIKCILSTSKMILCFFFNFEAFGREPQLYLNENSKQFYTWIYVNRVKMVIFQNLPKHGFIFADNEPVREIKDLYIIIIGIY